MYLFGSFLGSLFFAFIILSKLLKSAPKYSSGVQEPRVWGPPGAGQRHADEEADEHHPQPLHRVWLRPSEQGGRGRAGPASTSPRTDWLRLRNSGIGL